MITFSGVRRVRLGDYSPGQTDPTIEDVQNALNTIGFNIVVHGVYDTQTGAAVLEFRDATGLPHVNQIDEQFQARLYDEVDRVRGTGSVPGLHPVVRMDPLHITGNTGSGLGWLALLIGAGVAYKYFGDV